MNTYLIDLENDEVMTIKDFKDSIKIGAFVDDDGIGYYSDGKLYFRDRPAVPSVIYKYGSLSGYSHVVWFNK